MNNIKYFLQFLIIVILFLIFKIIGLKNSTYISGKLFNFFGPLFRSNKICHNNLSLAFPELNKLERNKIIKNMWFNYGGILAEYIFIKKIKYSKNIKVENQFILDSIKEKSEPVIFVSGHFNNFELMAMHIEKSGIDLAAIYRPLNNKFLNPIMEQIRKTHICKKQIKKGISGTKKVLKYFKNGTSIALMIDQRVSEGISCDFFGRKALTTTIPAQFVKKFNCKVVPIYIQREQADNFKLEILRPIEFSKDATIELITLNLNQVLENLIKRNPDQWIWSHNRWK